jgi:hypothetical protein
MARQLSWKAKEQALLEVVMRYDEPNAKRGIIPSELKDNAEVRAEFVMLKKARDEAEAQGLMLTMFNDIDFGEDDDDDPDFL